MTLAPPPPHPPPGVQADGGTPGSMEPGRSHPAEAVELAVSLQPPLAGRGDPRVSMLLRLVGEPSIHACLSLDQARELEAQLAGAVARAELVTGRRKVGAGAGAEGGEQADGRTSWIATEVRRRRKTLHLTLRDAAERTGVSYTVLSQVENGIRIPSPRTYQKLRAGLGLEAPPTVLLPPSPTAGLLEDHLQRLAACVVLERRVALADVATTLGKTIPAIREGLLAIAGRLASVGLRAHEDGDVVQVGPLPCAEPPVVARKEEGALLPELVLSEDQFEVIAICAHLGAATRAEIDELRHADSEALIAGLVSHGLLEKARDSALPRAPNLYRVTATALAATRHPTLESLRAAIADGLAGGQR